jgi:hypothetical protein
MTEERNYFGLESGGQFGSTFSGLPPLCTVGAAESDPPASGSTALFSMAMELAVFSSPLPVVAAGDVVHAVSGLSLEAAVDCAAAVLTLNIPARITAGMRIIIFSSGRKVPTWGKTFWRNEGSGKLRHCDHRAPGRMLGILGPVGAGFAFPVK